MHSHIQRTIQFVVLTPAGTGAHLQKYPKWYFSSRLNAGSINVVGLNTRVLQLAAAAVKAQAVQGIHV